jgi:hypothetical protein
VTRVTVLRAVELLRAAGHHVEADAVEALLRAATPPTVEQLIARALLPHMPEEEARAAARGLWEAHQAAEAEGRGPLDWIQARDALRGASGRRVTSAAVAEARWALRGEPS